MLKEQLSSDTSGGWFPLRGKSRPQQVDVALVNARIANPHGLAKPFILSFYHFIILFIYLFI